MPPDDSEDPSARSREAWTLLAEIEHRVANEYALAIASLSRAAMEVSDVEAKAAVLGAVERLRDYAAAHRARQEPAGEGLVELSDYLRTLCSAMSRASLNERGIHLRLLGEQVELEPARCWRVGLIVSELIVNAMRHGLGESRGAITVAITASPDHVQCRVSDNGQPPPNPKPGQGSRIVDALAAELGGAVEREFTAGGSTVRLCFPHPPERSGSAASGVIEVPST
jgi:two-component sensor histidine kinase